MSSRALSALGPVFVLLSLFCGGKTAVLAAGDGYLSRRVEILVYPSEPDFETTGRGWMLRREVSLFKGYLWRHSSRRLSVQTRITVVHRDLEPTEFRDYGPRFGFLLDRSPGVQQDLRLLEGGAASSVVLLYDPPPGRPSRLAGRTFFEGAHSSIPLRPTYFRDHGFALPLHLVLVHEYLHQIDLAFSRANRPAEFLDPDGVGTTEYPSCIEIQHPDLSMRTLLKYSRSCDPIKWELLSPEYGTWVKR